MTDRDNITLPRKHIDYAAHALEHFNKDAPDQLVSEIIHHLRTALAAEPTKPEPVAKACWACNGKGCLRDIDTAGLLPCVVCKPQEGKT